MKLASRLRLLIMIAVLALSVAIVAAQDEAVLVIGHAESTDSLDPARGYTQTTGIINRATYNTLVTFPDEDASDILPMLATDWTIDEDGTQYTFTLRDGVTFVSGNPLTAADVAAGIGADLDVDSALARVRRGAHASASSVCARASSTSPGPTPSAAW